MTLEDRAKQLRTELSLQPAEQDYVTSHSFSAEIPASPYVVVVHFQKGQGYPTPQGEKTRPDKIQITLYEGTAARRSTEPLLNTPHSLPFPENIIRFKENWDTHKHHLDNNFRLTIILTHIFAILIPEHMPQQ
jgi:hypothetical protein